MTADTTTPETAAPDDAPALLDQLADAYLAYGQPAQAAVLLRARLALVDDDAQATRARLALAWALVRSEAPEAALAELDTLVLVGASQPGFHLVRAQALQALGRLDEAAAALRAHAAQRAAASPSAAGT